MLEIMRALPATENRDNYIRVLVEAETAREAFEMDYRLARQFAISGQFDDLKKGSPEQNIATAMTKIQLGRSWGFSQADSVRYIYFTNGKPAVENDIVAGKLSQAGYAWDIEWSWRTVDKDKQGKPVTPYKRCAGCTLWLKRWDSDSKTYRPMLDRSNEQISETFTEADALTAMIWEKGSQIPLLEKWNYQSWPRDMFYWRAISRVRKFHAPAVLRGGVVREEAYDAIPGESQPDILPPDMAAAAIEAAEPSPESNKGKLKSRILSQESFLGGPDAA